MLRCRCASAEVFYLWWLLEHYMNDYDSVFEGGFSMSFVGRSIRWKTSRCWWLSAVTEAERIVSS